jgi:hypothetical protein
MRALRTPIGAVPRVFTDHRRGVAKRYREYCIAFQEQWGAVPRAGLPTLREAALAAIELERLAKDLEDARRRNRRRDAIRVRKQQFMLREQLQRLERRLQELTERRSPELRALAGGRA